MKNGQCPIISLLRNRRPRGKKIQTLSYLKEKYSLDCPAAITSHRFYCFVCRLRSAENKYLQLRASRHNEHPEVRLHPEVSGNHLMTEKKGDKAAEKKLSQL